MLQLPIRRHLNSCRRHSSYSSKPNEDPGGQARVPGEEGGGGPHRAAVTTPHGPRRSHEARIERDGKPPLVARFGGILLVRDRKAVARLVKDGARDDLPGTVCAA